MIKCTECGYENMDGLDYCDGCGAKLAATEGAAAAAPEPAPAEGTAVAAEAPASEQPVAEAAEPTAEATPAEKDAPAEAAEEAALAAEGEPPAASEAKTGEIAEPAPAPAASATPASEVPHFKAKLKILRGVPEARKGHEFPLEGGQNFIGRWDPETGSFPEVDLEQDDPEAKISRKHALIIIEGDKITIEDIGSLNGTYVNRGNRLIPGTPLELKPGDEVIIGKTFLKLVVDPIS
jgi:FHA domain